MKCPYCHKEITYIYKKEEATALVVYYTLCPECKQVIASELKKKEGAK